MFINLSIADIMFANCSGEAMYKETSFKINLTDGAAKMPSPDEEPDYKIIRACILIWTKHFTACTLSLSQIVPKAAMQCPLYSLTSKNKAQVIFRI